MEALEVFGYVGAALLLHFLIGLLIAIRYERHARAAFQAANKRAPSPGALEIAMAGMMVAWPVWGPWSWWTRFAFWKQRV